MRFLGHAVNRAQRRNISKGKNPIDLVRLAELHQTGGRLEEAEQKYREAIVLHPNLACAHNNLGDLLHKTGRLAEATEHLARAFKISPKDSAVVFNLAKAFYAQGRFREANTLYREAISLRPLSSGAYFGFAVTLVELGEHEEAKLNFLKALDVDPRHWQARVSLGMLLVDEGKIVEAFEHAEILARGEAATDFPHKTFGILLARAGCPDGARQCFEAHLAANPADKDAIALLLATVGGPLPERVTDQQVALVYNASRASRWDQDATGPASYQGHRLVVAAIDELNSQRVDAIIDAGCGTGLVGELLRAKTGHLVGVDMSDAMLAQAQRKNIYDELHRGDLVEYLDCHPRSCDVISSAATLIHFGNLNPVFGAAARCLRPGGLFVFTVFPNDDDPDAAAIGKLDGSAQGGCFVHGPGYVTQTAGKHGFRVEVMRRDGHEYARSRLIFSLVVALRLH